VQNTGTNKKILTIIKMTTGRKFFRNMALMAAVAVTSASAQAQRLSRDLNVDLLVNQVGYVPNIGKTVVVKGTTTRKYKIINTVTQETAFEGSFKPSAGDFGEYSVGDFSAMTKEGTYYIISDTLRSFPFKISKTVYATPMDMIVGYFSLQRCGPSQTGYMTPCHIDDGIRLDNGKHQDVTGGWHDASDLRKWVSATIYGMIGLSKTYELTDKSSPERNKIYDELLWGNSYFLKMQEPEGYVMNFIGGDVRNNGDNNRWTDNIIGNEGGEVRFDKPTSGKSQNMTLTFGFNDDRVIRTDPVDMVSQYNFVTSEAIMARIVKVKDADYAQKCLLAAKKCFDWCSKSGDEPTAGVIGSSIQAAVEMYKTTGESEYGDFAASRAKLLKTLQVGYNKGVASGFFRKSQSKTEPYKQIWQGPLEFISVCDLIRTFPTHKDVAQWREMVYDYSVHYLSFFSDKNSFGIVPFGLYTGENPGGNRKTGDYWYRYFMHPQSNWWVGINANLASAGVGLIKAADARFARSCNERSWRR
jgi:hypothetical protein